MSHAKDLESPEDAQRREHEAQLRRVVVKNAREYGAAKTRSDIAFNLRRRADRREQSATTTEHEQEVRWLRAIAGDIAVGLEDIE